MTMIITVLLLAKVAIERWHWPGWVVWAGASVFLVIDGLFFGANLLKVAQGGWLPILIGVVLFTAMTTWKTGRRILFERLTARSIPLDRFMAIVADQSPARVPGTSVFMTAQAQGTPPALVHNLRHNKVLHEKVVVLTVLTTQVPHVPPDEQVEVRELGAGVSNVLVRYGFAQNPDVPEALRLAQGLGLEASGAPCDRQRYDAHYWNTLREALARVKAFKDVAISKALPKFLGPRIPIDGDGRASWDERQDQLLKAETRKP